MKGFTKLDNELLFSPELSAYSKLVLASLNYYTRNGKGQCFAKKTTLAKMIGISLHFLRKSLNELEEMQLIHITRRGQGNPDIIELVSSSSPGESLPPSIIEEDKLEVESAVSTKNEDEITKEIGNEPAATETTPEIPPETPNDIEPIQEYLEETETLTKCLRHSMREVAFSTFIDGKVCISYADKEKMLIKCADTHTQYWLSTSYRGMVERITGKRCEFVRG